MIEERLIALVTEALTVAARELGLSGDLPEVELSKPRRRNTVTSRRTWRSSSQPGSSARRVR